MVYLILVTISIYIYIGFKLHVAITSKTAVSDAFKKYQMTGNNIDAFNASYNRENKINAIEKLKIFKTTNILRSVLTMGLPAFICCFSALFCYGLGFAFCFFLIVCSASMYCWVRFIALPRRIKFKQLFLSMDIEDINQISEKKLKYTKNPTSMGCITTSYCFIDFDRYLIIPWKNIKNISAIISDKLTSYGVATIFTFEITDTNDETLGGFNPVCYFKPEENTKEDVEKTSTENIAEPPKEETDTDVGVIQFEDSDLSINEPKYFEDIKGGKVAKRRKKEAPSKPEEPKLYYEYLYEYLSEMRKKEQDRRPGSKFYFIPTSYSAVRLYMLKLKKEVTAYNPQIVVSIQRVDGFTSEREPKQIL